ncbi:MAG: hypothetical protein H0U75_12785 [Legionella sp.]|nr:hypothetical protein [Legionella sp.]
MIITIEMEKINYQILKHICFLKLFKKIQEEYDIEDDFYEWLTDIKQWMIGIKEHEDLNKYRKRKELLLSVQKTITELLDSLELDDALQEPTVDFQIALEKELNLLPNIEAKRPQDTYAWRLVNFLIIMYKNKTNARLSCYYSFHKRCYNGKFYYFLIDIVPLLECIGITIDTKISTLAGYAAKLIPQRRKDKPYSTDISQIDETLLQA